MLRCIFQEGHLFHGTICFRWSGNLVTLAAKKSRATAISTSRKCTGQIVPRLVMTLEWMELSFVITVHASSSSICVFSKKKMLFFHCPHPICTSSILLLTTVSLLRSPGGTPLVVKASKFLTYIMDYETHHSTTVNSSLA